MQTTCRHGMVTEFCGHCNPRPKPVPKTPQVQLKKTVHGSGSLNVRTAQTLGYLFLSVQKKKTEEQITSLLDERVTFIHINGHLFLWVLRLLIEKAPNLKTVRVIPKQYYKLSSAHLDLCKDNNIEIVTGHHKPEIAWKEEKTRLPWYKTQKRFFEDLSGEQKKLFEELLYFGIESAEITARYFCLNGEEYVTQSTLAEMYGHNASMHAAISGRIGAVMRYLDSTFETGEDSIQQASVLKKKVQLLRERYGETVKLAQKMDVMRALLVKATGCSTVKIPDKLPVSKYQIYEQLLNAMIDGKFYELKNSSPKRFEVLLQRFGFKEGKYKTLEACAEMMGLTRERIRQLEHSGLVLLGISEEE